MAPPNLPRSNFGTASLLERKNALPPVDVGEGAPAEVEVAEEGIAEGPGLNIELEEDGGVVVDFDPHVEREDSGDFYENLAELLSDQEMSKISSELVDEYETNKNGRKDWEEAYSTGLQLLGFKYEDRSRTFSRCYRRNASSSG